MGNDGAQARYVSRPVSVVSAPALGATERSLAGDTLQVRDLQVWVGDAHILRGVTFDVDPGEVVALAGESGSGKSTAILAVPRLLPGGSRVSGTVRYGSLDLATLDRRQLRQFRASAARIVFQDPWSTLHPLQTIGSQLSESARSADPSLNRRAARELAGETLQQVGIPDAAARLRAYPHEVSGGQLQRIVIAMALVAAPALMLCDEPTTALDVTTQAQILELLSELNRDRGISIVLATHDLEVIADIADRLVVMYGGRVMEQGPTEDVLQRPGHPYTSALLQAAPGYDPGARLRPIQGRPPSATSQASGCAFASRCEHATDVCTVIDPLLRPLAHHERHASACLRIEGYGPVSASDFEERGV